MHKPPPVTVFTATLFDGSPAVAIWGAAPPAARRQPAASSIPSFADFYALWRLEMRPQWRRTHRDGVDQVFEAHLLPGFGPRLLTDIARADVLAFRARLADRPGYRGPLSASRINKVMVLLHQMLAEAGRRHGFVPPTEGIKRLKAIPPEVYPFSLAEVQALCDAIRPDFRAYLVTRFFTGLRTGEVDGLRWHNVDFERDEIRVREVFTAGEGEANVKTSGSFRDVPMLPNVRTVLRAHREAAPPEAYVFTTPHGKPVCARNFTNRVWYPLLDRLGLARRRPYQTRHTCATLMLAAGENPEWVARVMGHANTQMLFTVYSRYVPNLTRSDGTAMSALLQRSSEVVV